MRLVLRIAEELSDLVGTGNKTLVVRGCRAFSQPVVCNFRGWWMTAGFASACVFATYGVETGSCPLAGTAGKTHQPIPSPPDSFDPAAADFGPQEVGNEFAGPISKVDDVADRPN